MSTKTVIERNGFKVTIEGDGFEVKVVDGKLVIKDAKDNMNSKQPVAQKEEANKWKDSFDELLANLRKGQSNDKYTALIVACKHTHLKEQDVSDLAEEHGLLGPITFHANNGASAYIVTFPFPDDALQAMSSLNGRELDGKKLIVKLL